MRLKKRIPMVILGVFIAFQFIQPSGNKSEEVLPTDISHVYSIPVNVYALFKNACYDCHSNNTNYPLYSMVQPIRWMIEGDIQDGKEKLNFSEFGSYSARRQGSKWVDIEKRIKDGKMPLSSYQLIHKNARLTDEDKALLIDWIEIAKDSIERKNNSK